MTHTGNPFQLWLVSRHGTRYPSKAGIAAISEELPELLRQAAAAPNASTLCPETLEALGAWRPDVAPEQAKRLHAQGEMELTSLAGERKTQFNY